MIRTVAFCLLAIPVHPGLVNAPLIQWAPLSNSSYPISPRAGAFGLALRSSGLASFIGGVPDAPPVTCAVGPPPAPASLQLQLSLGSTPTVAGPEVATASILSSQLGAAASVPAGVLPGGRLVSFSSASSDVLLWDGGATAPSVCPAAASPRPVPRASGGLVYLARCNATTACFVLYGGDLASGGRTGDMWLLFGADAPVAACTWQQVVPSAFAGDAMPPLSAFSMVADAAGAQAVIYGGVLASGAPSASVYRFAPLGFADATPAEMLNIAQPQGGLVPVASQSTLPAASLGWGGFASRAIDNMRYPGSQSINTAYWSNGCQHTAPGDTNAWWSVDLGAVQAIDAVVLYQRTDCCRMRFSGFAIYISNSTTGGPAAPWSPAYTVPLPYADLSQTSVMFRTAPGTTGRHVWVNLPGANRLLTLCEVQVFKKQPFVVRNYNKDSNVARGAPTWAAFTSFPTSGGGLLSNNAVDGINDLSGNGASTVSVLGPTGATAASSSSLTPYWGVDLGSVYTLGSGPLGLPVRIFPSSVTGYNSRVSVWVGHSRDWRMLTQCWGPATLTATAGGALGAGGYTDMPACAGLSARYVMVTRGLINSPPAGDLNTLALLEVEVYAAVQGVIPAAARYAHASARLGAFMFVFGGISASGRALGDLQLFDLGANAWIAPAPTPLGSPPEARSFASMLVLPPGWGASSTQAYSQIAVFGGLGASGLLGDVSIFTTPSCPPLSLFGASGMTCDETNTVCTVTCIAGWVSTNPATGNTFTCALDGTWGLAVLPPCTGRLATAPASVDANIIAGTDASGRGAVAVSWTPPASLAYTAIGQLDGQDNRGGDMLVPVQPTIVPGGFSACWALCNSTVDCMAYGSWGVRGAAIRCCNWPVGIFLSGGGEGWGGSRAPGSP